MLSTKEIMEKYPWTIYKYDNKKYCMIEDMPTGWRKAFGDEMLEELDKYLTKYNIRDDYHIIQIKEKFGELRWYDNGYVREGKEDYWNIMDKYALKSIYTCIECGKPATRISKGWISPYCDDCIDENHSVPIEEFYKKLEEF